MLDTLCRSLQEVVSANFCASTSSISLAKSSVRGLQDLKVVRVLHSFVPGKATLSGDVLDGFGVKRPANGMESRYEQRRGLPIPSLECHDCEEGHGLVELGGIGYAAKQLLRSYAFFQVADRHCGDLPEAGSKDWVPQVS